MSEVDLTIGGRKFKIICADGEERSLRIAADVLDSEAQFITAQVGQVSDSRMLLMAGLLLADKMVNAEGAGSEGSPAVSAATGMSDDAAAKMREAHEAEITTLRARIDELTTSEQAARREVTDLQTEMTAKVAAVAALESRLAAHGQDEAAQNVATQDAAAQNAELEKLQAMIAEQSSALEAKNNELEAQVKELETLRQQLSEQDAELQALRQKEDGVEPEMFSLLDTVAARLEGLVDRSETATKSGGND